MSNVCGKEELVDISHSFEGLVDAHQSSDFSPRVFRMDGRWEKMRYGPFSCIR